MRMLILSDMHFEKGSSYARRGALLPPYDTRATLARVTALVKHYAPTRIIALGDSFHDKDAADRLDAVEREMLLALSKAADWIWIAGNHDPEPPSWLSGQIAEEVAIGGLSFRHEPSAVPFAGEIAGHLHPCASVTRRGRTLRRRCFVSDGARLVMPAFGAYAGGLDVRETAVRMLFPDIFRAYVLGARRVYAVAA
jgi:DNA ligase-associated metallophosphoesterase